MRQIITKFIEVEEIAALTYEEFARNGSCDPNLERVWQEMAKDEHDHAMQLKFALRLPFYQTFDGFSDRCPNPEEAKCFVDAAYNKALLGTQTPQEMLDAALEIENRLLKIHAVYVLLFKEPELLKLFKSLARADEIHVQRLEDFARSYRERHSAG
ncbi:MAG: hypothetical protein C0622_14285 [Desulfuromonas sp.]|nr:MAG: hypothetical protein C0622_14285 [Desulfuromonas sp.]